MTGAERLRDKLKFNMMMIHDSIEISGRIFGFATPAGEADGDHGRCGTSGGEGVWK